MRVLAVDYGDRRIGLALSDETATLCGRAWTIEESDFQRAARLIADEAQIAGVDRIVLGLPKNMNGSIGPRAEKSIELSELLRELSGLDVILWDERRTTVDAHRILSENNRHGKKRKERIDAVAASLILEGYLGSLK